MATLVVLVFSILAYATTSSRGKYSRRAEVHRAGPGLTSVAGLLGSAFFYRSALSDPWGIARIGSGNRWNRPAHPATSAPWSIASGRPGALLAGVPPAGVGRRYMSVAGGLARWFRRRRGVIRRPGASAGARRSTVLLLPVISIYFAIGLAARRPTGRRWSCNRWRALSRLLRFRSVPDAQRRKPSPCGISRPRLWASRSSFRVHRPIGCSRGFHLRADSISRRAPSQCSRARGGSHCRAIRCSGRCGLPLAASCATRWSSEAQRPSRRDRLAGASPASF